ncbi:hypothetical protein LA080_010331 [Diaporthe eres]|nr:hypothetical protein LA080_010331 [Diaporthe eres]
MRCSGWLAGCTGLGRTTLENRDGRPADHARDGSMVLETRGTRLILILGVRGGAEESCLYCTAGSADANREQERARDNQSSAALVIQRESLQLAVRCQLNQLISGGRHVIKQRPGKVRRFGDLSQPAGSWRATTAVPSLHSDLG